MFLFAGSASLFAQEIHWKTDFVFYGDNTELTHFFRVGETILGAQFKTFLQLDSVLSALIRP